MKIKGIFTLAATETGFFYSTECEYEDCGGYQAVYFEALPDGSDISSYSLGFSRDCISIAKHHEVDADEITYFGVGKDAEPIIFLTFGPYQIGFIDDEYHIVKNGDGFSVKLKGYQRVFKEKMEKSGRAMTFSITVRKA